MKQVVLTKYGSPEVLQVKEFNNPEPKPQKGEVDALVLTMYRSVLLAPLIAARRAAIGLTGVYFGHLSSLLIYAARLHGHCVTQEPHAFY